MNKSQPRLEFEEEELSGQLVVVGARGTYWLECGAWCYLTLVTSDAAGPITNKLGTFAIVEDAISYAQEFDLGYIDEDTE